MEQRYGGNGVAVHRAELIGVLRSLLGDRVVHLSAACTSFRQDADGVTARFADGREARGDLLIGADGVHSGIAEQLFGPLTLRYAGFHVWRAVTDFELRPPVGVTTMGRGAQFGLFQMTGGRVYWFASHNAAEGGWLQSWSDKDRLLARFGGWHAPIKDVIVATDPASTLVHSVYDREPLQRWSVGRVTLLGDAAHPALPNLGQGACQALEDAAVLGTCLRDDADISAALRRYQARRIARANAMTVQARRLAWLGSWERQPYRWLRDRMIRWSPGWATDRHLRWLFTFDAETSGEVNGQHAAHARGARCASEDQTDVRSEQHQRSDQSASALE
jgi:2-polyprenyl-6-methoxyphenol hydroxylase-like FAD-dependent oxidoreductase